MGFQLEKMTLIADDVESCNQLYPKLLSCIRCGRLAPVTVGVTYNTGPVPLRIHEGEIGFCDGELKVVIKHYGSEASDFALFYADDNTSDQAGLYWRRWGSTASKSSKGFVLCGFCCDAVHEDFRARISSELGIYESDLGTNWSGGSQELRSDVLRDERHADDSNFFSREAVMFVSVPEQIRKWEKVKI